MVKTISKPILIVFFIWLMHACVTDINIELPKNNNIVMNGIIVPGDTIGIALYRSKQVQDTMVFETLNDAVVTLFINEEETGLLHYTDKGKYQSEQIAEELTSYKITVETEGFETIWAETKTPASDFGAYVYNAYELDTLQPTWPYYLEMSAYTNRIENCWLASFYTNQDYDTLGNPIVVNDMRHSFYSNSSYIDKFNSTYDPDGYYYNYDYLRFIHVYTNNLNAEKILIEFTTGGNGGLIEENLVVYNMDDHYSNYLKSKLINEQGPDYLSDDGPPLNYKPSFLYSNVHGGFGILGSYTTYTKTYTYK